MQEIVNVRIDERLIHGQVAVLWAKYTGATRIMIIDDNVVHDEINKAALKMVCPAECKLSILNAKRAAENLMIGKYDGEKVFILAKGPKALKDVTDYGYIFDTINVGNMGGKQDSVQIKKSVSCTKEDIENFKYLISKGTKITAIMAPEDADVNFEELLNKYE